MLAVATVGLAVNAFVAVILFKGNRENLNIRSALLHVLGDLLGSVGAIVASVFILAFGWNLADPIVSVLVALLVLTGGWRVTGEAVHILMEGKPTSLSITQIKKSLQALSGVRDVHDLHVWSITSGFHSFSCHLVVGQEVDRDLLLQKASEMLEEKFGIRHTTIQMEGERSRIIEDENCCN